MRLCRKFAVEKVENNRLKQYILCLLPTAQLKLKAVYVPARTQMCIVWHLYTDDFD